MFGFNRGGKPEARKREMPLSEALLPQLLKPSYVKNEPDNVQINSSLNRVIMAVGWPRRVRAGWLNNIIASEGDFDLSMFIEPSDIQKILSDLNHELVKQRSDMIAAEQKGVVNPSLKVQYDDTYRTLESLQMGEEKLFNISLYANARAGTKERLELLSSKIRSEFNSMGIDSKIPYRKMQQAIQSIIPIKDDRLRVQRNIPSSPLSACFPFTSSFLNLQEGGVVFGLNKDNNIPIILDVYNLQNYSGLILGTSGSGKSFFVKLYILRNLLRGVRTMIIDPQGEYVELCKTYGGQLIEISQESNTIINPLDLLDRDFGDKMLSLMDLFKIMCGELSEPQKNFLDKALLKIYAEKGIKAGDKTTWGRPPPVLRDLYDVFKSERNGVSKFEKMTYDALLNRLRIYAEGSFSFMNKQTNLDLNNNLICFNIADMPAQVKPVMMYLILDFVHKKMQKDRERKLLVVDEAWTLLRYGEHAQYLFELIKTARKFGLGLAIITQEVNDLLASRTGKTIMANTAWKLLLRQEPTVMGEVVEKFNLNTEEQNFVLTAGKGDGLLFAMNDRIPLKIVASEKEYEIITTNPDELRNRDKKRKGGTENEKLNDEVFNLKRVYFPKSELNEQQAQYLSGKGFEEGKFVDLESKGPKSYLIKKPETKESLEHYFFVQLVYDEIRKYTENVQLYASYGPDICFQVASKEDPDKFERFALEIETGKSFSKKEEQVLQKAGKNSVQNYKDWWFVLTDSGKRKEYAQYGKVLLRTEVGETLRKLFG